MQFVVVLPQRCFRKARVEPVNAYISLSVFMAHGHVFHTRAIFDHVAHSLQFGNKAIKGVSSGHGKRHILAHHAADGRLAYFAAEPIGIALPFAVGFNDGEPVLPAEFIGNLADAFVIGVEVVPEHSAVYKGNRIGYDVVMQMSLVQMGGNGAFKAVSQKAARKLAADLMHLLRRSLTGGKALDNVVRQNALVSWHKPRFIFCRKPFCVRHNLCHKGAGFFDDFAHDGFGSFFRLLLAAWNFRGG